MDGAGTCRRLCFHCWCCSTEWLQWGDSTAVNWKGNNPGSKGQLGKEGPRHGAAWDRDSEQALATVPGTRSGAANGRNPSMACSTQPSWKLSAPGRQGANTAKPKPSPTMPSLAFGGSMATGRATPLPWHPGALPAAAPLCGGLADTAAPLGKWQCRTWMCHHEPGNCQGQHWERGAQLRDG